MSKRTLFAAGRIPARRLPVTVIAHDTWEGVPMVCVRDPNIPNPAGIPDLDCAWVPAVSLPPFLLPH